MLIFTLLCFIPSVLLDTWAVELLWGWFINFTAPSFWNMAGCLLLARYVIVRIMPADDSKKELTADYAATHIARFIVYPLATIGIGWCYHRLGG